MILKTHRRNAAGRSAGTFAGLRRIPLFDACILQIGKSVIYYIDTLLTLEQYLFGKVGICLKKENIFSMEL